MAFIRFENVCVDFPIYNARSRSIKNMVMQAATGGRVDFGAKETIVRSLSDVSFSLTQGDRVGLIGHNGAGKSTLLRTIGRVYEPTFGKVAIKGSIGSLVDISLGIDREATGRENIFIRGALLGLTQEEIKYHFNDIVKFSELGDFIDMPVRTYSSGMHLRLAFSVATVIRPQILLMDEWLSVGDAAFNAKARNRLRNMVEASEILVIASHSKKLIEETCNKVFWFEHGRLKLIGDTKEVCSLYWK